MVIRKTPTAENLKLLYDVINEIMPDLDVYYTAAELGEKRRKNGRRENTIREALADPDRT